ncbi:MAG: monooxygenase, partial [Chromatiales bacterium]|nr:monooxygenase [Chromatiales bacterium]
VGAGPIGLAAALELARHGIHSVILDDKSTVNDGSRAVCLARHSLENLQQLGLAEAFLENALGWTQGRSYYRSEQVYTLSMPHSDDERYLPMYNLQQQYTEQLLIDAAARSPFIELRWSSACTGVTQQTDRVSVEVETAVGTYAMQARYCLAADGARSAVRHALNLPLHGEAYEGRYAIADIRLHSNFPTERRAFFDPPAVPGGTLLVHKQPHNIWRVDWQLEAEEDETQALQEERMRAKIGLILDMLGEQGDWELEWWSIYKAYTLCLDDYRHGRVLFLGDAAHLVPIFGVRGLNSGLADAANVGWKLAWVLKGRSPDTLLDSYSPERRGATLDVFANASKSTAFMTPPTYGYKLLRDAALSLSLRNEFARAFLNPRQSTPYTYADSALTSHSHQEPRFNAGPGCGAPLINRRLRSGGYLLDHLGPAFSLLMFSDEALEQMTSRLGDVQKAIGAWAPLVTILLVSKSGIRPKGFDNVVSIGDADGAVANAYGAATATVYLVRPDRHVCARWLACDYAELAEAVSVAQGILVQ